MERMTEGRRDDLGKGGAQSAGLICRRIRLNAQIDVIGTGDMTEFMNHSTLLRHHQEEQQA